MPENKIELRLQIGSRVMRGEVPESFEKAPLPALILIADALKKMQSDPFELTDLSLEEKDRLLQQLLFEGKATKNVVLGNKVKVTLESFTTKESLAMDSTEKGIEVPLNATRKYDIDYDMVKTLAKGVLAYNGLSIGDTRLERETFILNLPWPVVLYLGKCWNIFMGEIAELLESDVIGDLVRK